MQLSSRFFVKSKTAAFILWDIKKSRKCLESNQKFILEMIFKKNIMLYKKSAG